MAEGEIRDTYELRRRGHIGHDDHQHAGHAAGDKEIEEKKPKVRIMLGGASINPDIVEKYSADGYAKSAGTAVDEAIYLIKMLKEEELQK